MAACGDCKVIYFAAGPPWVMARPLIPVGDKETPPRIMPTRIMEKHEILFGDIKDAPLPCRLWYWLYYYLYGCFFRYGHMM